MQSKYFKYSPLILAINTALFMAMSAHADEVIVIDSTDTQDEALLPATTVDPIVITSDSQPTITENTKAYTAPATSSATGLTLSAQETPQSMSVITNQQMKDQNLTDLSKALDSSIGVSAKSLDGARVSLSARGFGINQYQVDGMNSYFRGGSSASETSTNTAIYDHIEVVRGATGLMTGTGDPSASINLVRKHANNKTPVTEISATANRFGNYGVSIDHSQALTASGNVRGRVIAGYSDGDTYIEREQKGNIIAYTTIDADIGDNTTANIGVSYQKNKQHAAMWGALPAYFSDGTKTDWDVSKNASVDWANWDSENLNYFAGLQHTFANGWQGSIKGSYSDNTAKPKLFYINGTVVDKQTGLGVKPLSARYDRYRDQQVIQTDISGYFDAFGQTHQFIIGATHDKNHTLSQSYDAIDPAPISSFLTWDGSYPEPKWKDNTGDVEETDDTTTTQNGAFISTQLKLAEPLSVILGSRFANYKVKGNSYGDELNRNFSSIKTPYAGVVYDINNNHSLYVNYADIFKPQEERKENGDYLDPIRGTNYEIGVKSRSDNGKLQSQFSVFKIVQDNLAQLDSGKTVVGTKPPEDAYYGAKGATSQGIEVEVTGEINPNWQASIGYTQFNAKDRDDKAINTQYPNRTIKLFTTYDMSNVINGLTIGGGVNWADETYAYIANPVSKQNEKYTQKPVTLVNLMANYAITDNLAAQLNVTNLLNQKYYSRVGFYKQVFYGEPINVMGRLTYRF
ncbi:TonB-dependent siderophore receptor [Psychrobacter sp. I-STPA10]|uniref:TonB-dependent siderophore receptor n=1 Tax=Psychrobacter sp. I-STPA10 TaxID=2585769 RepID=UPI001E2EA46C|nr:TonB-dependent siderophore receptor [Psychrobacter sp. I-STPA10]